jgi:uncharacterized membrane protein YeiB
MIDTYALLALPLAVYFQRMLEEAPTWLRRASLAAVAVFVALNLVQSYQYNAGYIHHDSMSQKAYWEVLRTGDYPAKESLDAPDYEAALDGRAARY